MNKSISEQIVDNMRSRIQQPYVLAYVILTGMSSIMGICGNTMTIITFIGTKSLRETRNFFIINLALADLMVNGIVMPYSIIGALIGGVYFQAHRALCIFLSSVCAPGCLASMFTICSISCARYFYICNYAAYLKYFTKKRTCVYLLCVWLACFLVHSPNHFGWGHSDKYSTSFDMCTLDMSVFSYSLFYGSLVSMAISFTFFFYCRIYKTIKNSTLSKKMITAAADGGTPNKLDGQQPNNNTPLAAAAFKNEIKLIKTSFKIFLLFVFLWSPSALMILLGENSYLPKPAYLYMLLMAHSNSTMNFFIYYVDNKPFRNGLRSIFKKAFFIMVKTSVSEFRSTVVAQRAK